MSPTTGTSQVDAVAPADLREQARQRLAAGAAVLGDVRAEEHRVDAAAMRCEQLVHLHACMALTAAMSNSPRPMPDWLVATTVCQPAWLSARSRSSAPGTGTIRRGLDEVVAVLVDRAVAVEDDELHGR